MTQTHDTIRKDSELGPIPQEWEVSYVGEYGGLLPGYAFKSEDFGNHGIPIIKIKNISETGNVDLYNVDRVQENVLNEKTSKFLLGNGDFIVAMTGATIGKVGMINSCGEKILLNQRVGKFEVKNEKKLDKNFLYYCTQNKGFSDAINNIANGVAQANISGLQIESIPIPLPPISEQQAIASILGSLDDKIEVLREQNRTLEKMGQTMFYEWFGKYNVEDELPEGWRVGKLGEVTNIFTGRKNVNQANQDGEYRFFSCSPDVFHSDEFLYDGKAILVAGNGSFTGRVAYYNGKFDLYQRTYAVTKKEGLVNNIMNYIYFIMKNSFEPNYMGGSRGSSIPYIVMGDIANFEFILPNDKILVEFEKSIDALLEKIENDEEEIQSLIQTRDSLLPRLMSGKVRVF